jgi:hypothetical protein
MCYNEIDIDRKAKDVHLQEAELASGFGGTSFLSSVESIHPPLYAPFAN